MAGTATAAPTPARARRVVTCRGCGARIFFGITQSDKAIPLDERVTTVAELGDDGKHVRIIKAHVPHHITCPKRDEFRGPRREDP